MNSDLAGPLFYPFSQPFLQIKFVFILPTTYERGDVISPGFWMRAPRHRGAKQLARWHTASGRAWKGPQCGTDQEPHSVTLPPTP